MIVDNLKPLEEYFSSQPLDVIDASLMPMERSRNTMPYFRSALMLSAHNLKHLNKIDELDADCIILNLEDGVSSELKPVALRQCAYFLSQLASCEKKLVIRVNALDEGGDKEIQYLKAFKPDAIRIPKVKTLDDVTMALELMDDTTELHLSIETKEAWNNLSTLGLHPRVRALYLGILDLFADLQLPHELITLNNPTMHYMLAHFLITCKSSSVLPVSFVYQEYKDLKRFKEWVMLEKEMGFFSKGCISPTQAIIANEVFRLDDSIIEKAKTIVRLFEQQQARGITGFSDDKLGFIDEPIYKGALSLLHLNSY